VPHWGTGHWPPPYLYHDLPKRVVRNVSRFHLCGHALAVKSSIWCGGNGHCDNLKCCGAAVQNEVHVLFHCQDLLSCTCVLSQKEIHVPYFSFLPVLFCGGPLYFACLA